ncbi:MAG: HAMP domain-containing histidine kinase [Planctomycetes bacterium]|nr:HAMP domain-containing histidine kinase [Planctomycetota bacterium]
MMSLRLRVALVCAGAVLVMLMLGAWLTARHVAAGMRAGFDRVLVDHLGTAASGLEFEHGGVERHGQGPEVDGFALITSTGRRLAGQSWMQAPAHLPEDGRPTIVDLAMPDGRRCRAAWMSYLPESDDGQSDRLAIGIAISIEPLLRQLADIRDALLIGAVAVAATLIGVLALLLGRMLAPHGRLAVEVEALDPRLPGRRLATGDLPPELRTIAERTNQLCDRLERAYGLASSFHAAAAHELRTPLAGLRATIEVAGQPGGDPQRALGTCHAIAMQMQARIDNLLMAARIDAGKLVPRREEVDVHALLRSAWEPAPERIRERGLEALWDLQGEGLAIADPEALRMVLANLFDNAISYAPAGSRIEVSCATAGDRLTLRIANPAPGLDADDAARVFQRGWRCASTGDEVRHAGLGMGIARELTGLMSGRIEARAGDGRFTVELVLPAPAGFDYW